MTNFWLKNTNLQQNNERFLFYFQHKTLTKSAYKTTSKTNYIYTKLWQNQQIIQHQNQLYLYKTLTKSADKTTSINSCAKSSWYARRQHSYNICKDFLSHKSGMKNRNFTKKYTDGKTIDSNNCAKFEVNWPRGSQFTVRHTKNRLQFDE